MMRFLLLAVLIATGLTAHAADRVLPPEQPANGPGGSALPWDKLSEKRFDRGRNGYWIVWPTEAKEPLPVICFLHGWGVMSVDPYRGWIEHLARRGNVVIYPQYQETLLDNPADMTRIAGRALKNALGKLGEGGIPAMQEDHFAFVGHSLGGTISINLTNNPQKHDLPQAKAVMAVEPGDTKDGGGGRTLGFLVKRVFEGSASIPKETLMLVLVGEDDRVVSPKLAARMFNEAKLVPLENKDHITLHTDRHGTYALRADHFVPLAAAKNARSRFGAPNAYDYLVCWKLFDGLTDAAFFGKNREYALGNTPEQRSVGKWSDGKAVRELTVTDAPK